MGAAAMLGFDDIGRYQFRMIVESLDKRVEAVFWTSYLIFMQTA